MPPSALPDGDPAPADGSLPAADLDARTSLYGRSVPQWAVLVQLVAHMNEHLGQSIAYARSNGVTPPWSAGGGE